MEVVADQEVGAETDPFPADEHEQQVVAQHQHQHEEHEQVQIGEEAVEAFLFVHVADGVNMDQEADSGHHHEHDTGERIDQKCDVRLECPRLDPSEDRDFMSLFGPVRKICLISVMDATTNEQNTARRRCRL